MDFKESSVSSNSLLNGTLSVLRKTELESTNSDADNSSQQEQARANGQSGLAGEEVSTIVSHTPKNLTCLQFRTTSTSTSVPSERTSHLPGLPIEVFQQIFAQLKSRASALALCNASKDIRAKVAPMLFKELTLTASDVPSGNKFSPAFYQRFAVEHPPPLSRGFQPVLSDSYVSRCIQHLHLVAPFRDHLKWRCSHVRRYFEKSMYYAVPGNEDTHPFLAENPGLNIAPLLAQIPDGQLRSFRYN